MLYWPIKQSEQRGLPKQEFADQATTLTGRVQPATAVSASLQHSNAYSNT